MLSEPTLKSAFQLESSYFNQVYKIYFCLVASAQIMIYAFINASCRRGITDTVERSASTASTFCNVFT